MNFRAHIVIADKGWILEKCASEIARYSSNVSYGLENDPSADIQYYVNYSKWQRKVSAIELAFFTHREKDANASRRYFDAIHTVDHCVFMSKRYADEITDIDDSRKSVIAPGVDLKTFRPKVRVGVVGRTYHTGRKGEGLVAQLLDIEGIEWRFTGGGWPLPSTRVADGDMPAFYNDLDYVLVPALYEGGPMTVLEGLACGVPIIASDVGWVNEYPHIAFENGNADSLRAVLTGLVAERNVVRESVLDRTWEAWGTQHIELFDRLGHAHGLAARQVSSAPHSARHGVSLLTHGGEGVTLGGPSVRVPRTADALVRQGWSASLATETKSNWDDHEVAHIFNIWPVDSTLQAIRRAKAAGKFTVLSTIFLNLSDHIRTQEPIARLFEGRNSHAAIDLGLRAMARQLAAEPNLPSVEPMEGYYASVQRCISEVDAVICLSDYERRCLAAIDAEPSLCALVRNPIDVDRFASADPDLFRSQFDLDEYILCVGRIEHRKNQLVLAHAARTLGKKVVFIGHDGNAHYADLVRKVAGPFGVFVPRIEPSDPLLASAFAGASVFCLPSWAEGAPLAALEAAAAGVPLVLSDRSSEAEYFGDKAQYVHPANIDGMREALLRAIDSPDRADNAQVIQARLRQQNSWDGYARDTIALYEKILASNEAVARPVPCDRGKLYFDLTTSFHGTGNPTGIARVERRLFEALIELYGERLIPVVWNSSTGSYLAIDVMTVLAGTSLEALTLLERKGKVTKLTDLPEDTDARMIVVGGAWIRNPKYIRAIRQLKQRRGCALTLMVHDLIQLKMKRLYPNGIGDEFEHNAIRMCDAADSFVTYSDCSRKDLHAFLIKHGHFYKRIDKVRLGDLTSLSSSGNAVMDFESDLTRAYSGKSFVIFVSSIEVRKNHVLLINVWRRLIKERGGAAPHLLFIGRVLPQGDAMIEALEDEPELGRYVHMLRDVGDDDLDWFYRNCAFTVFPSLYEGWGLPVAESLSFGRACIAASGTSIDEIAPGLVDLIDPYDFRAWLDRITFYIDNPVAVAQREAEIREGYHPASWLDAARNLHESASKAQMSEQFRPFLVPGKRIELKANQSQDALDQFESEGWSHPELKGRWTVGASAVLAFRFASEHDGMTLRMNARSFAPSGIATRTFFVRLDGGETISIDVPTRPCTIDFKFLGSPADDKGLEREAFLEIRPAELISPISIGVGADDRQLGLFVETIELLGADGDTAEVSVALGDDIPSAQSSSPTTPQIMTEGLDMLTRAWALVTLPERFSGRGRTARLMRATGLDRLYLRRQARLHRREFESIRLIIEYLRGK